MPELEPRYPCPVCLGVPLEKLSIAEASGLVLDYCRRCGGIWFDENEVGALRAAKRGALGQRVRLTDAAWRMRCHYCQAVMDRNVNQCPACHHLNRLRCPKCDRELRTVQRGALKLDACRRCRGVWFDNVELAGIWNSSVLVPGRPTDVGYGAADVVVDNFLLHAMLAPDLTAGAAAGAIEAGGVLATAAPVADAAVGIGDMAEGAVEGVAEGAESVFEAIAGVIGDLLSGL
jgi:Zn-finger nucleic acid-binding protein